MEKSSVLESPSGPAVSSAGGRCFRSAWLLVAIFLWQSMAPLRGQQAGLHYNVELAAVRVTGYSGPPGAVVIPDRMFGLPVVAIDHGAFRRTRVTSVSIPTGVTNIGEYAFDGCCMNRKPGLLC